jgi:hypothetical protein
VRDDTLKEFREAYYRLIRDSFLAPFRGRAFRTKYRAWFRRSERKEWR